MTMTMTMMMDKTVLVTGSTDGIGKQAALELARMGAHVLVHGRNRTRGEAAVDEIRRASSNSRVELLIADLSSLAQVRELAKQVQDEYDRLDVLINNAGVFMADRRLTADGLEMTFGVNHLAHFLLTSLLLGLVQSSAPARIITVSSVLHQNARLDFDNLQGEARFDGHEAYAVSKLCNVLFAVELAVRLRGSRVTSNTLHPGVINTKLLRAGFGGAGASLENGAAALAYLAGSPDVATISGEYFVKQRPAAPSPLAQDAQLRMALWRASERLSEKANS